MDGNPLENLWKDESSKDLTFVVEGKCIKCHRCIVAHASPVFSAFLSQNFKEGTLTEIPVEEEKHTIFSGVIEYFYTQNVMLHLENVHDFMTAADKWGINTLKRTCVEFLRRSISDTTCLGVVDLARLFIWPPYDIESIALRYIGENPDKCYQYYDRLRFSEIQKVISTFTSSTGSDETDRYICLGLLKKIDSVDLSSEENLKNADELMKPVVEKFNTFVVLENVIDVYSKGEVFRNERLIEICMQTLRDLNKSRELLCNTEYKTFDSIMDRLKHPSVPESECGGIILAWLELNEDERRSHTAALFSKYPKVVASSLKKTNVWGVFRIARANECKEVHESCMFWIGENIILLENDFKRASFIEIRDIFYFLKSRKSTNTDNIATSSIIESYRTIKGNIDTKKPCSSHKVASLDSVNRKHFISLEDLLNCYEGKFFPTSNQRSPRHKEACIGNIILNWIRENVTSESDEIKRLVVYLLREFHDEISEVLSESNMVELYSIAQQRRCLSLEARCFSFLLQHSCKFTTAVVTLTFEEISTFILCTFLLYKGKCEINTFLGKILAHWFVPRSAVMALLMKSAERHLRLNNRSQHDESLFSQFGPQLEAFLTTLNVKESLLTTLKIARRMTVTHFTNNIRKMCIENFQTLKTGDNLKDVHIDDIKEIVASPDLNVTNEDIIVEKILEWLRNNPEKGKRNENPEICLFQLVRFPFLTPTMLIKIFDEYPDMFLNPELRKRYHFANAFHSYQGQKSLIVASEAFKPRLSYGLKPYAIGFPVEFFFPLSFNVRLLSLTNTE